MIQLNHEYAKRHWSGPSIWVSFLLHCSVHGRFTNANLHRSPGPKWPWLTTCVYIGILVVEYPQVCNPSSPQATDIKPNSSSKELHHRPCTSRQVSVFQHCCMGHCAGLPRRLQQPRGSHHSPNTPRYLRVCLPACLRRAFRHVVPP